jgi:hypothetical protein
LNTIGQNCQDFPWKSLSFPFPESLFSGEEIIAFDAIVHEKDAKSGQIADNPEAQPPPFLQTSDIVDVRAM